jgi:prepilin-type processing-associated H-X9-DG protein
VPCQFDDLSYVYYGFAMTAAQVFNDPASADDPNGAVDINPDFVAGFTDFIDGISSWTPPNDGVFNDDISSGDLTVHRLREGIERFFITDINNPASSSLAQSELFVLFDDISSGNPEFMNHIPGGCNILYMDGHVQFERYPGRFPIAPGWMAVLEVL